MSDTSDPKISLEKAKSQWYVYLLRCADDSFYTGVTTDPERRQREHNGEIKGKGAIYTRSRRPVSLSIAIPLPSKVAVYQAEYAIKQMSRVDKISVVRQGLEHPLFKLRLG